MFNDFLNLFFFDKREGLGAVLKALESKGYFQSLAEPNLIAYNGQEASFLAGGEFPIPIVQGTTNAVTIEFKEFGVRLTFKPTIAGDVIRLKVKPEVSSLDFNNGITLQGFRIPALLTRRAETDVELRDGQSFAIAGLLNNVTQEDKAAIPILSKLPIIGVLFKSKAERAERTELMVLITPRLVRPLDPDEVPPLPTRPKSFLPAPTGDEDAPAAGAETGGPALGPPRTNDMTPSPVVSRTPRANAIPVRLCATPAGRRRDRGAVLVHVAVAMSGLLAFSALSIDLGTLWVARGAGAERRRRGGAGRRRVAGLRRPGRHRRGAGSGADRRAAAQHLGRAGRAGLAGDAVSGPCPAGSPSGPGDCLGVVVQHDMPAFFSRLFGMGSTNVRASATAKVLTGNASNCLRPLAIMDSWTPPSGPWQWDDRFAPPDTYAPTGPHPRLGAGRRGASEPRHGQRPGRAGRQRVLQPRLVTPGLSSR